MYQVLMNVLCLGGYSEVLPGDVENTELIIEDLVALILLDIFGTVVIDGVKVTYLPFTTSRSSLCRLQVHAVCATEAVQLQTKTLDTLEAIIENHICCALIELFSTVLVGRVAVHDVCETEILQRSA